MLQHGEQGVRQAGEAGDKRKECVPATAGPCEEANASEGPLGTVTREVVRSTRGRTQRAEHGGERERESGRGAGAAHGGMRVALGNFERVSVVP